jgi:hypothetical protein
MQLLDDGCEAELRCSRYCSKAAADVPRQLWPACRECNKSVPRCVAALTKWYPPPCVQLASHTRVAHKDFPADEWLRSGRLDISRDSVAATERYRGVPSERCALWTSLMLHTEETACSEECGIETAIVDASEASMD